MKNLYFAATKLKDGFWKYYYNLMKNVTVYSIYDRFKETGRFNALNCNWQEGEPNHPHFFWDSDVAKWIEGTSYLLEIKRDEQLEKIIDDTVDIIEKNQRADGYFNSYFLSVAPSRIYLKRSEHELYCTGHLIEAAIAYHKATGKEKLLSCMLKNIDFIYRAFVVEKTARFVTPGHEEIELALLKLYDYLGNEKHLDLARFFINNRGNNETDGYDYYTQSDLPVREINDAVGHCVRACYLYTAMAKLAKIDSDKALENACKRVLNDIINYKMSITGGIGAIHIDEKFSYKYDLPNSNVYNETCAAISLAMFAGEMQQLEANSHYGDIVERIYYNGFISGISLDGDKFFYTNPLEIDQKKYKNEAYYQPPFERVKVFECSCCPPNVLRFLATIPRYMYTVDDNTVYCNQFGNCETKLEISGKEATIIQKTNYPTDGKIEFTYYGEPASLRVRIPEWCVEYKGETKNGFAEFDVKNGDAVTIDLPMKIHFIEANPSVQNNSGRYAVTRGPVVYCMEGIDNGENLRDITLLDDGRFEVKFEDGIPAPVLYIPAERRKNTNMLYQLKNDERVPFTARLIPYFSFSNRGVTDMLVWTMVK